MKTAGPYETARPPKIAWWTTPSFEDAKFRSGRMADDVAEAMATEWAKQLYGRYGVVGLIVRTPASRYAAYRVLLGEKRPGCALDDDAQEHKLLVMQTTKPKTPNA